MLLLLFLILLPGVAVESFSILNLDNLQVLLNPKNCTQDTFLVTLIHSAPQNAELRSTIRQTWGQDIKRIFVLGQSAQYDAEIQQESQEFADIVQVNFTDAYRNMTYKHLIGYWWVANHCHHAEFVLKSDDDQALDVYHLPKYLQEFVHKSSKHFLLCHAFPKTKPKRDFDNKWFVSLEEYPKDRY